MRQNELSRTAPFWQGAVVSLELHLPALRTVNFYEITEKYNPDPDLPIRFLAGSYTMGKLPDDPEDRP